MFLVLGIVAMAAVTGCGNGVESDESVAGVLEHFCRYEANSEDQEQRCFEDGISGGAEKMLHREEWGPRAQAVLYALGEMPGCLSHSGKRCELATWSVQTRPPSLLLKRYCYYGSKSTAQVAGCLAHVDEIKVVLYGTRTYPTNAGSYAVGDRTDCGYDSGPFCVSS